MDLIATLGAGALLAIGAPGGIAAGMVETVTGPVEPAALGRVLTHEHVLVDFIGAQEVSPDRYDADEVYQVMLPHLVELKDAGIDTLVECTPEWLGRDPVLLRRLSEASGVLLITNTGFYKDPFLPQWAHDATADELAELWTDEARNGIGDTGIKPGFIKIAVNEGDLSPIQAKIVRAAGLTSRATGLRIHAHTTTAATALEELDILEEVGLPGSRLIVVHADATPDLGIHAEIAEWGAWLSYDGIRADSAEAKLPLVIEALHRWPDQLLISQDAGWYSVGEPGGGDVVPWSWLPRKFVPMLLDAGAGRADVARLLVANPAQVLTIQEPTS